VPASRASRVGRESEWVLGPQVLEKDGAGGRKVASLTGGWVLIDVWAGSVPTYMCSTSCCTTSQQLCIHRVHCGRHILQQHHLLARLYSSLGQWSIANITLSVFCTLPACPLLHLELQLYCHELPLCACVIQAYFVNVHGCLRRLAACVRE